MPSWKKSGGLYTYDDASARRYAEIRGIRKHWQWHAVLRRCGDLQFLAQQTGEAVSPNSAKEDIALWFKEAEAEFAAAQPGGDAGA